MMKYTIEIDRTIPAPIVKFADGKYALAAEFLLAEARTFGAAILAALDKGLVGGEASSFSGNVFSLEIHRDITQVVNDITDNECEIPTSDFRRLTSEYVEACEKTY